MEIFRISLSSRIDFEYTCICVEVRRCSSVHIPSSVADPTLYRSLAGALQYLTFTRPDIMYDVQKICLYIHDPLEPHFTALKRILRYIRGTTHRWLQNFTLGHNLLSWSSKRQNTTSHSSVEAEYRGVANAVAETCWIHNLLLELHYMSVKATIVYFDNVSVVLHVIQSGSSPTHKAYRD